MSGCMVGRGVCSEALEPEPSCSRCEELCVQFKYTEFNAKSDMQSIILTTDRGTDDPIVFIQIIVMGREDRCLEHGVKYALKMGDNMQNDHYDPLIKLSQNQV